MAITFIDNHEMPNYIALSSDLNLSASLVVGTYNIGGLVYITDTQKWFIFSGSGTSASNCSIAIYKTPTAAT